MSVTVTERAHAPRGTEHVYALQLTDAPDALLRVLVLLHRRRCEIRHVDFALADRHRPGRLRVRVAAHDGRPGALRAWLAGLPDVLEVRQVSP
jgi:acetolactate synthase regulatory subunit